MTTIRFAAGVLVLTPTLLAGGQLTASKAETLCSRIDPASRRADIEEHKTRLTRISKTFPGKEGVEGVRAALPLLFSQLDDPDPRIRVEAVARLAIARGCFSYHDQEERSVANRLFSRLQKESQVQVVEELLFAASVPVDVAFVPALLEASSCDRDEKLQSVALQAVVGQQDPWRYEMLRAIADLGGSGGVTFLETAFRRAVKEDDRELIARVILGAQLERGKPEWGEEQIRNGVPFEDFRKRRLPFVQKEVSRLLDARNSAYFQASPMGAVAALRALSEWSRELDPNSRVAYWRRVLDMMGGSPALAEMPTAMRTSSCDRTACWPAGELAKALASRASQYADIGGDDARRDIDEAFQLADKIRGFRMERLQEIRARAEASRQRAAESHGSLRRYVGVYTKSTGESGDRLELREDGRYTLKSRSDDIDLSHPDGWTAEGRFHLEGNAVVLNPGTIMKREGIDAPDVFISVPWGRRTYLVRWSEMMDFCQWVNAGGFHDYEGMRFYADSAGMEKPAGLPEVPRAWREYLFETPVTAPVKKVMKNGDILLDAGEENGFRVGMVVYACDPDRGPWKITRIDRGSVLAAQVYSYQAQATIGLKVSTRKCGAEEKTKS